MLGLIFEPSLPDGAIVGERKGIGNFTVAIQGKSAHAGRDHALGRSAILAMSEFIIAAEALNGTKQDVTLNVGLVEGGESVNTVPASALCQIDVRVKHANEFNEIAQKIEAIAKRLGQKESITVKVDGELNRPPKSVTTKVQALFDAYANIARDLQLPIKMVQSGGCCDGNNLMAQGLANLDTLGVRGAKIHSDQEHMHIASLVERTQMNTLFLLRLARNEIFSNT